MFKNIDKKFEEIGFIKTKEDEHGVMYEREMPLRYIQVLSISRKKSGRHLIHSYDKDLMDEHKIGNICVGLTGYEMKLALKKMKQIKLYSK